MILSGEKKEEYREIKPYYDSRFKGYIPFIGNLKRIKFKFENEIMTGYALVDYEIIFKNGYQKNSPKIKCKVKIEKGYGKAEWGAEPGKRYYVLKILSVEEVKK